jgi:hypothetical protein
MSNGGGHSTQNTARGARILGQAAGFAMAGMAILSCVGCRSQAAAPAPVAPPAVAVAAAADAIPAQPQPATSVPAPVPTTAATVPARSKAAPAAPAAAKARRTAAAPKTTAAPAPRPVAADPSHFAFQSVDAQGRPARWNPCTEIRWAYNPADGPADAEALVTQGMSMLAEATGLRFRFVGTTTFEPQTGPANPPAGIDAVIGFGHRDRYPDFHDGTVGLGGFTSTPTEQGPKIISGQVALDAGALKVLTPGFGGGRAQGSLLLHELGHMVGLDHVGDAHQTMNPAVTAASPAGYAAGDRSGLAKVGAAAGCF